jgi:glycosyltransferase involved in cell wall biosynthesis
MSNIKITIVIPTKNRVENLRRSIATCLMQKYKDLEIIVSDNASNDNTEQIVKEIKDPRIKYFNTGKPLSMTSNFEFALKNVDSDYVMYIGDDDGVVPGGIQRIVNILYSDRVDAITCGECLFFWDKACLELKNNKIRERTLKFKISDKVESKNAKKMLEKFANMDLYWHHLPCIYRGIVKMDAVKRAMKNGVFFRSIIPDVYSAVAISAVIDRYLYCEQPFSIAGVSSVSNGLSQQKDNLKDKESPSFKFIKENDLKWHKDLPECIVSPFLKAESIMQAKTIGLLSEEFKVDFQRMIEMSWKEACNLPDCIGGELKRQIVVAAQKLGIDVASFNSQEVQDEGLTSETGLRYNWRTGHLSGICNKDIKTVADVAVYIGDFLKWRPWLLAIQSVWQNLSDAKNKIYEMADMKKVFFK